MVPIMLCMSIAFLSFMDFAYIRRENMMQIKKKILLKEILPQGMKQVMCFLMIPLSMVVIAFMYIRLYEMSILFTLKRMCIISLLWPAAVSDFIDLRIPNKLIIAGFILRLMILMIELIFMFDRVPATIRNETVAVVGAVLVSLVCMFLSRGSLGMGDLKLMALMGAFLGVEGICCCMFASLFFSFFVAVGLLLFRKKSKKDAIPFAPFILSGTIVGLFLTGV